MSILKSLVCPKTQMQTLTIMDKGVIENFDHMITIDECELEIHI